MNNHGKRTILQYVMNRFFLRLRPVPRWQDASVSTGGSGVDKLLESMTREEKIDYISGVDNFCVRSIPRLGIPPVWMGDATSGVRGVDAPVTIFPSGIAMAASWNRESIADVGSAIGEECRATGVSVLLGPGVNIARVPICGRNFEYMGEDPVLAGRMAQAYVKGVQSHQVAVTVKHFACNNSEYDRHKCDSIVDEKVLRQLYLPAFEMVIASGAKGVMTAYNPVNGSYMSGNRDLVESILRSEWGFDGIVVSDWNSLYSTESPLRFGVDIEMPVKKWFSRKALKSVLRDHPEWEMHVDRKVSRLLHLFDDLGVFDRSIVDDTAGCGTAEHRACARSIASEAIVLLENRQLLPLASDKLSHVVVVGSCLSGEPVGGGGSSFIKQGYPGKSLADQLEEQLGGCRITRLSGSWWCDESKRRELVSADAVIASVGFNHVFESESYDRPWELPSYDLQVITESCSLHENVVVAVHAGGAVKMSSWVEMPKAILYCWYLGEASSAAITDVLLGKVNPSGKLPISLARNLDDYESMRSYPKDFAKVSLARVQGGQGNPRKREVWPLVYDEGLMVGYRQFDTVGPQPLYPFGYGLSYTDFHISDLDVTRLGSLWRVFCRIQNVGSCLGAEVVQLYVRPKTCGRNRPFQQLRDFAKVYLAPHEERTVVLTIDERSFCEWDTTTRSWITVPDEYTIAVGVSSKDIRLTQTIQIKDSPDHGRM